VNSNRVAIMNALQNLLETGLNINFVTVGRKWRPSDQVSPEERPALFLVQVAELNELQAIGLPTITTMDVIVVIYVNTADAEVPADMLNDIVDQFETLFDPLALDQKQTLGGLVAHVWAEGKTFFMAGDVDGDGIAIIPIRILPPS
jgi:hypothetical protein